MRGAGEELVLAIRPADTLARTLWLESDLPPPALCSGLGRCGACRVQLDASGVLPAPLAIEHTVLGPVAVEAGWRLACRHPAQAGMIVRLDRPEAAAPAGETDPEPEGGGRFTTEDVPLWLGLDVGTTSVHWRAVDAAGGTVREGRALNPQMGAGSEVMSRLALAATPEGRGRLARRIRRFVRTLCAELPGPPRAICLAANTAMTTIFLDQDCTGLLAAPYSLPEAGGRTAHVPDLPPLWLPPQPAPFVGGDVAAGMAFLLDARTPYPFLLADLGTNGEFVLAVSATCSWVASVPMGPALEGIGLTHGGVAGPGSLVDFGLTPAGLVATRWSGEHGPNAGHPAPSISGTGYLALLALLVRHGLLTDEGRLVTSSQGLTPLAGRLLARVERAADGSWRLPLPHGLALTPYDVEEVLKVKAAFVVAVSALLRAAGLAAGDLAQLCLAGALGEHAPRQALERLGFVPAGLGDTLKVAGNTSLEGAARLVLRADLRERILDWNRTCRSLHLTDDPAFMAGYMACMRWSAHW